MVLTSYLECLTVWTRMRWAVFLLAFLVVAAPGSRPIWAQSTQVLTLAATNPDGTNTGTARVGVPVALTTTLTAGTYGNRGWSLTGAGTLVVSNVTNHAAATYTPPTTMPANASVTITVDLSSYPATSVSYPLTLVNPLAPTVTSTSPTQLLTGGTQTVTVTGSSFTPITTVTLGGTALTTTYTSYNQLSVQVPVAANAAGTLALQVQNPGVSGVATFNETVAPNSIAVAPVNGATVPLGGSLTMGATVSGSMQTAVNW